MDKSKSPRSSTDLPPNVQWAIAVENCDGQSYLSIVHLGTTCSGQQVFEEIRKQLCLAPFTDRGGGWVSRFFTKIIVGTATVYKVAVASSYLILKKYLLMELREDLSMRYRRTSLFPGKP